MTPPLKQINDGIMMAVFEENFGVLTKVTCFFLFCWVMWSRGHVYMMQKVCKKILYSFIFIYIYTCIVFHRYIYILVLYSKSICIYIYTVYFCMFFQTHLLICMYVSCCWLWQGWHHLFINLGTPHDRRIMTQTVV